MWFQNIHSTWLEITRLNVAIYPRSTKWLTTILIRSMRRTCSTFSSGRKKVSFQPTWLSLNTWNHLEDSWKKPPSSSYAQRSRSNSTSMPSFICWCWLGSSCTSCQTCKFIFAAWQFCRSIQVFFPWTWWSKSLRRALISQIRSPIWMVLNRFSLSKMLHTAN